MARTLLTKIVATGSFPSAGVVAALTAADASNGNSFQMNGNDLVIIWNDHATDAKTVTIHSSPNSNGRTGDITAFSIVAGTARLFGPLKKSEGWIQTGGVCHINGEDNNIKFSVIALPLNE